MKKNRERKPTPRGFIGVYEFSAMSGVSVHTLYKWREQGKGPLNTLRDGLICYPVAEFIKFMGSSEFGRYKTRREILAAHQVKFDEMYDFKGQKKSKKLGKKES